MATTTTKRKTTTGAPDQRLRAYFAALPAESRAGLEQIRDAIRSAAPGAEEAFSYGIPAFRLDERPLVYYAAWKTHYGMYPISESFAREHGTDLSRYETSKGTVRFPLSEKVPVPLVRKLLKARIAELRAKNAR